MVDGESEPRQLFTLVDKADADTLLNFLNPPNRRRFRNLQDVLNFDGVINDRIDFIDCVSTKYNVTPLMVASGKGSFEKVKILLVHGANPNKQCLTRDTALNLAVHRQKYHIVDLLLQYNANPNIPNQSGKTALHRAVASYNDENANHIQTLLLAGSDLYMEDKNQRIPIDEAALTNKPEIMNCLLMYDRNLIHKCYKACVIAARLGHDDCLKVLLDYGYDVKMVDRTHTTPLHVAVRSLKMSTTQLLVAYGADINVANNRGETPLSIAEYLAPEQQQIFVNILQKTNRIERIAHPELLLYTSGNSQVSAISYAYPLLQSHSNWTLDSDEYRSRTTPGSSVQNLLEPSNGTYWACPQPKDAWVIFDLKHQYNINGLRLIGCDNASTPKEGRIDVSNAFNGPWLKVKVFQCPIGNRNIHDIFFQPVKTRFVRIFITENYGAADIRIQGIGLYGVDMQLVNLLKEFKLEESLNALLASGINDLETLDEKRDEVLNSANFVGVNEYFQFKKLIESIKAPKLTYLEWFNQPQSTVMSGKKLQTFSATGDENVTDRVKLEEKNELSPHAVTILLRDLEPIQGRSLVDFSDYSIQQPGRYEIRVVSMERPEIHTPWHKIVVGSKLTDIKPVYEHLYPNNNQLNSLSSETPHFFRKDYNSLDRQPEDTNQGLFTAIYEPVLDERLASIRSTFYPVKSNIYSFSKKRTPIATEHLIAYKYISEESTSDNNNDDDDDNMTGKITSNQYHPVTHTTHAMTSDNEFRRHKRNGTNESSSTSRRAGQSEKQEAQQRYDSNYENDRPSRSRSYGKQEKNESSGSISRTKLQPKLSQEYKSHQQQQQSSINTGSESENEQFTGKRINNSIQPINRSKHRTNFNQSSPREKEKNEHHNPYDNRTFDQNIQTLDSQDDEITYQGQVSPYTSNYLTPTKYRVKSRPALSSHTYNSDTVTYTNVIVPSSYNRTPSIPRYEQPKSSTSTTGHKTKQNTSTKCPRSIILEDWEHSDEWGEYTMPATNQHERYLTPTRFREASKNQLKQKQRPKSLSQSYSTDNSDSANDSDDSINGVIDKTKLNNGKRQVPLYSALDDKQYHIQGGDLSVRPVIPEEKNLYNYIPTHTELTFKAVVQGPGKLYALQRADQVINRIKQKDQNTLQKSTSGDSLLSKKNNETHINHSPRLHPAGESLIVNDNNPQRNREEPIVTMPDKKNNDHLIYDDQKPVSAGKSTIYESNSPINVPQNVPQTLYSPTNETKDQRKASVIANQPSHGYGLYESIDSPSPILSPKNTTSQNSQVQISDERYNFGPSPSNPIYLQHGKQISRETIEEDEQEENDGNHSIYQVLGQSPVNNGSNRINRNGRLQQREPQSHQDEESPYADADPPLTLLTNAETNTSDSLQGYNIPKSRYYRSFETTPSYDERRTTSTSVKQHDRVYENTYDPKLKSNYVNRESSVYDNAQDTQSRTSFSSHVRPGAISSTDPDIETPPSHTNKRISDYDEQAQSSSVIESLPQQYNTSDQQQQPQQSHHPTRYESNRTISSQYSNSDKSNVSKIDNKKKNKKK
ncbi:unnamed protein product [Didymodactylos carnosus]|uniref:F5/8 type C domain-containing protein n=1 Tax=Didymodactylos carnosus TaxID=1234261 RepID=A0A813P3E9_9BILA|nr:unnamed protein product [Didymodactylos carnosus]CAF0864039.1 unnamed protein product [Didymodactylos carnosus]CAF3526002.1 unnamed protein product [Didymodactylos carnosus]CAF3648794.1 unnamed protein product [Didymodactylos carnosus]